MKKTISLATSKLLKEAGFRQDKSSFYSVDSGDKREKGYEGYKPHWMIVDSNCASARRNNTKNDKWPDEQIAMPNTDELLEELPNLSISIINKCFIVENHQVKYTNSSMSLCEALAAMWLYLKKEGLLNAKTK